MRNYLFELHMHTDEVSPCGKVPAREAVRLYQKLGYDGVCITDHFTAGFFEALGDRSWNEKVDAYLQGYHEAREEGKKLGVQVILGMEYLLPNTCDDILIYGFDKDFLYSQENLCLLEEGELKALAQAHDLLLIQAHPFRKKISRTYESLVNGFEAFNGNPRHDSMNERAEKHARDFRGIVISGSDFHQPQDAGTGGVYLPCLPSDSFELARLLREIKTPELIRNDRESRNE